ncbi:MAG: DUF3891 family protein [Anaerolineae bacterium]
MIRLPYQDGYLLIPQPAHAWLSGQLAQHWGNGKRVDRPAPYQAVVLATTLHDAGWLDKDGIPSLNAQQEPLDFLEPVLDDVQGVYERGVTNVQQIDPYASLLVNRHIKTIYHSRAVHGRDPLERLQPLLDDLDAHYQRTLAQIKAHPLYQAHLDPDTLDHNYRIVRTCDLLSLFVCGAFPTREVSDVPLRYGAPFERLTCTLIDADTLQVSPNIFNQAQITVHLQARVIPQRQYSTPDAYREAFENAEFVTLTKTVCGV